MDYDDFWICEICGEPIGGHSDHKECSKIKKEKYGDSQENKRPIKKLSKKGCDYLADRFTRL